MVSKNYFIVFLLISLFSCTDIQVKTLNILIAESEQIKLDSLKELSENSKIIKEQSKKFIKGKIIFESDTFKTKIRFKGDLKDHLRQGDESFKLKLTNGLFQNMGSFALHRPERRRNLYEYMWHQIADYEGLHSLYYDFIMLSINRETRGVYAIEEKINSSYLNRKNIGSWSLYRFDERGYWNDFNEDKRKTIHDYIQNAGIYKIGDKKNRRDSISQLIQKVFDGVLAASDVFEVDKTARFLALCDLFGIEHGLVWINLRFLFDPYKGKVELVAFDGEPGYTIKKLAVTRSGVLQDRPNDEILFYLLSDKHIFDAYKVYLQKYSQIKKLKEWKYFLTPLIESKREIVDLQVPGITYSWEFMEKNQRKMMELF